MEAYLEPLASVAAGRVVYRVKGSSPDPLSPPETHLYSAPDDGSQAAIQLDGLVGGVRRDVTPWLSPDGLWVAFVPAVGENVLYVAPVDGSRPARAVSAPMVAGGQVYGTHFGYQFSSDSRFLVYGADQETDGAGELFLGSITKPVCRAR